MFSDQQRAEIVEAAVRKARSNRRLRQEYGLGILGWITLGIGLVRLIIQVIQLLRDRESIPAQSASRPSVYSKLTSAGYDADLVRVVNDAEFEVMGQ